MRKRGRTLLRFQPKTPGNDGFGSNVDAGQWGEGIPIGVILKPASGREALESGQVAGEQVYNVEVRSSYFVGENAIDVRWRAFDEARGIAYNIVAIAAMDGDYRWTRVTLETGAPP